MIRKTAIALSAALTAALFAAPAAFAQEAGPIDADGDGFVTLAELQAVYPDLTPEAFAALDVNGDGLLDAAELAAAAPAEEVAPAE